MFAVNGILFNHESPRRGGTFVTKKVTSGIARIISGAQKTLVLGNIDAKRDWGHAKDYVVAMWKMLQVDVPEDFVVSTGKQYTVRQLVSFCFDLLGRPIAWQGEGLDEEGVDKATKETLVRISEKYYRPAEVDTLLGDCSKAKEKLGWVPETSFEDLVREMMEFDLKQHGLSLPSSAAKVMQQRLPVAGDCNERQRRTVKRPATLLSEDTGVALRTTTKRTRNVCLKNSI